MAETTTAAFLVRAARRIQPGSAIFAGFNWPVLAARLARRNGLQFMECYEAGAVVDSAPVTLPSSTTDYDAYAGSVSWSGATPDLLALIPRLDAVFLDASTVDVRGCVNSFGEGDTFRSAGGGGSADVAARARLLLLLHAGTDVRRIERRVSSVTAAPRPGSEVVLLTRWGTAKVGEQPEVLDAIDGPAGEAFVSHLAALGAETGDVRQTQSCTPAELAGAHELLVEAAGRGYRAAARALAE